MNGVRRPIAAGLTRAGSAWRTRRLSLAGLPRATAWFARLTLVAILGAAAAIVLKASGVRVDIASYDLQPTVLLLAGGLATANAAIAAGAGQARRRWIGIGLVSLTSLAGAMLGRLLVQTGRQQLALSAFALNPADQADLVHSATFATAAGWLGVIAAIGTIIAVVQRRRPIVVGALAAMPYLLAIAAYLVADPVYHPEVLPTPGSGRLLVAYAIETFLPVLQQGPLVALILWQALEYARWSIDIGGRAVRLRLDPVRLLAVVIVLKLGWLVLGYVGRLPASSAWEASRQDGPVAWILAFGFAAVGGWWLTTRRRVIASENGTDVAAGIVVVAFIVSSVLATILLEAGFVATLVIPAPAGEATSLSALVAWLGSRFGLLSLLSIPFAAVLALVLLRARRAPEIALFMVIFAIWAGVRAIPIIPALLDPAAAAVASNPASIEPLTLDAAVTVVIAVLFAFWLTGRQRASSPRDLLLVLVASTFMAYAGAVASDTMGSALGGIAIYVSVLFPFAFRYLWNAGSLNAASADRPARLLIVMGLGALTLVVATSGLLAGTPAPPYEELARAILLVPAVATLVVASLGVGRATQPAPGAAATPAPRAA